MIYKRTNPQFNEEARKKVLMLLRAKDIDMVLRNRITIAFDYYSNHPEKFDGATIVKDLVDCAGLDLSALRHDYEYSRILSGMKGWTWLRYKLRSDYNYGKTMEKLGKGAFVPYVRTVLLWISTPLYPLAKLILWRKNEKNRYRSL